MNSGSQALTTSEPPHSPVQPWRFRLITSAVIAAWLLLSLRLIQLQFWDQSDLQQQARKQRLYEQRIPARPGEIVDRHGRLLATTITKKSLYVVPKCISDLKNTAQSLATILDLDTESLLQQLKQNKRKRFLWIKRRITESEALQIRKLKLPENSWGFREEYLRQYPQGALAAHVIGFRDIDGIGHGGIEQSYDQLLRGTDGRQMLLRDAKGRVIDVINELSDMPQHGRTIVLTIDSILQLFAEQELEQALQQWHAEAGSIILMQPKTCEILAMASRPTINLQQPEHAEPSHWNNISIGSAYEPGSTFKPFIISWALEHNYVQHDDLFDCEQGRYKMGNRILHDHHPYGRLSVSDILVYSSNIGMAKIGELLTNEQLYEATLAFGFGRKTAISLPAESSGYVRPLKQWDHYSTGSIPMGQELSATPLQIITAHAALASGGVLKTPQIVIGDTEAFPYIHKNKAVPPAVVVSRPVSDEVANWLLQQPLKDVVERGTGTVANMPGYSVFGKTGTAQKWDSDTGRYSDTEYVCSFICGAPAKNPQVLVYVLIDNPQNSDNPSGGTIAGPIARRLLEKSLYQLGIPSENN